MFVEQWIKGCLMQWKGDLTVIWSSHGRGPGCMASTYYRRFVIKVTSQLASSKPSVLLRRWRWWEILLIVTPPPSSTDTRFDAELLAHDYEVEVQRSLGKDHDLGHTVRADTALRLFGSIGALATSSGWEGHQRVRLRNYRSLSISNFWEGCRVHHPGHTSTWHTANRWWIQDDASRWNIWVSSGTFASWNCGINPYGSLHGLWLQEWPPILGVP